MTALEAGATTRGRLIDAATDLFAERGYEGTTMQEVARRAGLTTGAIYGNFRDKADLLLHAIQASTDRMTADMEVARAEGLSATERLVRMGASLADPSKGRDRQLVVEVFAAARRDPTLRDRVKAGVDVLEQVLARLVERAQRDGDVAADVDSRAAARLCLSLSLGFQHLAVLHAEDGLDADLWLGAVRRAVSGLA
jgi:AcrR family transcriptional regulator